MAASVHVKFDSNIFSGSGYDAVSIGYQNQDPPRLPAGQFQGTASAVARWHKSIFVDSLDDLYICYCYDLYEQVHAGRRPDYTVNVDGPLTARTLDFLGAVDILRCSSNGGGDPFAWFSSGQCYRALRFQLGGIWKANTIAAGSSAPGVSRRAASETATQNWWLHRRGRWRCCGSRPLVRDDSFEAPGIAGHDHG